MPFRKNRFFSAKNLMFLHLLLMISVSAMSNNAKVSEKKVFKYPRKPKNVSEKAFKKYMNSSSPKHRSKKDTLLKNATSLCKAIDEKDSKKVKKILSTKPLYLECRQPANEYSALELAASLGLVEITKLLLKRQAKVNQVNVYDRYPLTMAIRYGNFEVSKLLYCEDIDLQHTTLNGYTHLMYAALSGDLKTTEWLLDLGSDINFTNENGDSALIVAIYNRKPAIIRLLLQRGADICQRSVSAHKSNAIESACALNMMEQAELLLCHHIIDDSLTESDLKRLQDVETTKGYASGDMLMIFYHQVKADLEMSFMYQQQSMSKMAIIDKFMDTRNQCNEIDGLLDHFEQTGSSKLKEAINVHVTHPYLDDIIASYIGPISPFYHPLEEIEATILDFKSFADVKESEELTI